jgi:hypothetical protein
MSDRNRYVSPVSTVAGVGEDAAGRGPQAVGDPLALAAALAIWPPRAARRDRSPDARLSEFLAAHPECLGAIASIFDLLSEVKSTHGMALLIELRQALAEGRRPITCGEARAFLSQSRNLSVAGSKKIMRRLVELGLTVPVPNPCIDKVVDLHASPRLVQVIPVLGKPYHLFRNSRDGTLARKRFDTAWLSRRLASPENRRLAEWVALWEQHRPGPGSVPNSLVPFFASPLARQNSPAITAIVSVEAEKAGDFEFLAVDGPALQDPPFEKSARKRFLRCFSYPALAHALKADFLEAKILAQPMFHHLKGDIRGHRHDYYRLILPISTRRGEVDCLLIVSELSSERLTAKPPIKK